MVDNRRKMNFAEVVRSSLPISPAEPTNNPLPSKSKLSEKCRFFLGGHCKFGNHCKYDHSIEDSVTPNTNNFDALKVECGICIDAPIGTLYGILSHCDCKFCLHCIREWRKEGVYVAKEAEQVRYTHNLLFSGWQHVIFFFICVDFVRCVGKNLFLLFPPQDLFKE